MEYTKLGQTDIAISKVCVGCMSFGKAGTMHDWTLDEAATEEVVKHALDLGINFFDTANGYSAGTSEEYLGRALKKNVSRDTIGSFHALHTMGLVTEGGAYIDETLSGTLEIVVGKDAILILVYGVFTFER